MSHIQIVFARLAAPNGDLVFTNTPLDRTATISGEFPPLQVFAGGGPPAEAVITGSFPALQVQIAGTATPIDFVEISGSFDALQITAASVYDSRTTRYLQNAVTAPHQAAVSARPERSSAWNKGVIERGGTDMRWQRSTRAGQAVDAVQQPGQPKQAPHDSLWQRATRAGNQADAAAQTAIPLTQGFDAAYQDATPVGSTTTLVVEAAEQRNRRWTQQWNPSTRTGTQHSGRLGASPFRRGRQAVVGPWQKGRRPPQGRELWPLPVPPEPTPCYTPSAELVFSWPFGVRNIAEIIFICGDYVAPPTPITVPVRRAYIVLNTVTLRRAANNADVPTFALSLSIDVQSWTYGWQATIPASARSLVESASGPVELKATINGTEYRLLAERIAQERSFGDARVRVSGRGKNAVLDAPYAPVGAFGNTQQRTAQQLMEDALTVNNTPIGWSIDWALTDWLVPAGAWSHQGTYISALQRIAEAAGGYLAPHPTANTIRVRHLYPSAPWNWGSITPDFVLPADVVSQESIEWLTKPEYNSVYVSGQNQGVLGRVKITGTAGDLLAPLVVDPLITHVDAARQRGRSILSDTGKQARVGLRLPVLTETGIIQPGAFVQYNDGATNRRGLVRSTSVDAAFPEVWQRLEVETHV